jgi:hypothetical protein
MLNNIEQLRLYYLGKFLDLKSRHSFISHKTDVENDRTSKSAVLNGTDSYLEVLSNLEDFSLGSSPSPTKVSNQKWTHAKDDNQFTIDCWIKPVFGGDRYYPICSSFSKQWWPLNTGGIYNTGWAFQVDCSTGKIQMVNYCLNKVLIFESTLTIKNNTWSHVAISAYQTPDLYSNKFFYVNGKHDVGIFKSGFPSLASTEFKSYATWSNCLGYLSTFFDSTRYEVKIVQGLVSESVSRYDTVACSSNNYYVKSRNTSFDQIDKVGIITGSGGSLTTVKGQMTEKGYVEHSGWNWVSGTHLYIDYSSGRLSTVKPTRGPVLESIALAVSPTKIWFFPFWELGNYEVPDKIDYSEPLKNSLSELDIAFTYSGSAGKYVSVRGYEQDQNIVKIGIVTEDGGLEKQNYLNEDITISGYVNNNDWNLTPGEDVYVDSSYKITQIRPISNSQVKSYGYALDKNTIWFSYGWKTSIIAYTDIEVSVGDIVVKNPENDKFSRIRPILEDSTLGMVYKKISNLKYEIVLNGNISKSGWNFITGKSLYVDSISKELTQNKSSRTVLIGSVYGSSQIWFRPSIEEDERCPMYIGVGPRSYYFDKFVSEQDEFSLSRGYYFKGLIKELRLCSEPRFSIEGVSFNPQNLVYEAIPTTTSSTSTVTSTTTATTTRPVEAIPFQVKSDDFLSLRLQSYLFDYSNKHTIVPIGDLPSNVTEGVFSFRFNGNGYLKVMGSLEEFSLGATLLPSFSNDDPCAVGNNVFSMDFWIYPEQIENTRYLGICSSFGNWFFPFVEGVDPLMATESSLEFRVGWSLQIDSYTGKLQMVGYNRERYSSTTLESSFSIPFNIWSHVCVMSWKDGGTYPKRFYLNGVPDVTYNPFLRIYPSENGPYIDSNMYWCNGVHKDSIGASANSHAYFYLGASPKTNMTDPVGLQEDKFNIHEAYKFKGSIRNFRISSVKRYDYWGFDVPENDISTSSTTTVTTTTFTTTTTFGTSTFTTTVNPLVKLYGKPISSSSQYDGRPELAFDGNESTAWKPLIPNDSWIGISFIEDK